MAIDSISLPKSLFHRFLEASSMLEELNDELEDFLLAQDSEFLEKMRAARKAHRAERIRPLSETLHNL